MPLRYATHTQAPACINTHENNQLLRKYQGRKTQQRPLEHRCYFDLYLHTVRRNTRHTHSDFLPVIFSTMTPETLPFPRKKKPVKTNTFLPVSSSH